MSNELEHLAHRLEDDPYFLACPLMLYAKSEGLGEEQLAAALGCAKENLVLVQLCRATSGDDARCSDDIEAIATRFSLDADALAEAIRRGQAIFQFRRTQTTSGTMVAARDDDNDKRRTRREAALNLASGFPSWRGRFGKGHG